MKKKWIIDSRMIQLAFMVVVIIAIVFSIQINFLVFHTLAEFFSIVIASATFIFIVSTYQYHDNSYVYILGLTLFFVSIFDIFHTMSYQGINLFQGYDTNLPTQLWIAARFLQSVGFLFAILKIGKKVNTRVLFVIITSVVVILMVSIFARVFPDCYIEGQGLTAFKIIAEYVICTILLISIWFLVKKRQWLDKRIYRSMLLMTIFTILSELSFTFYVSVYDLSNIVGHIFKILAFFFLFEAILNIGLDDPFSLMYAQLQEAQEGLRLTRKVFDVSLNAILVLDLNWRVTQFNRAAVSLTGYHREEMTGMEIHSFYNAENFSAIKEKMMLALTHQSSWMGELMGQKKDGTSVPHMVIFQTVQDESEKLQNYLCIMIDISKRKEVEILLEIEREKLAEEVVEKTTELRQKNQELTIALETQEHFLATISHELRTPLNAVIGYSDMMMSQNQSEDQKNHYSEMINQSGHHLLSLINDMLDISRMDAGKLNLYIEPSSMTDILDAVISLVQQQADQKNITINADFCCDQQLFLLDSRRVLQILTNLLNNAVKFSSEGSSIEFDVQYHENEQHFIFRISDHGIGITETDQKNIFTPFFQVDSTLNRQFDGTGLGLAVVKHLVTAMGGSIWLESSIGKGTTFFVEIPSGEKKKLADTEN